MSAMAFVYIILCLIMGFIGRNRTIGFFGFTILSVLFTPFIIGVVLSVSSSKTVDAK